MKLYKGLMIILTTLLIFSTLSCSKKRQLPTLELQDPNKITGILHQDKNRQKLITISAVGDIMLGTDFPSTDYLPEDDGVLLLTDVKKHLENTHITFGNLEGSFSDTAKCLKSCTDPKKCYAFKMPEKYVHLLKDAGFNLLSIANNHINDFGVEGRETTIKVLKSNNINFAGVETHPSTVFKKDGIKFGFCAFSPNNGVPDLRDIENACKIVKKLSRKSDIVIVSFHGGAEGAENRHVTRKEEFFYGENRGNVYQFAHRIIDAGADIVLGHGPHISRAIELYKNRFIAYSMGNFCTYARFNLKGINGIAPLFKLNLNHKGEFLSGRIISIEQKYRQGPAPDPGNRAINEIIELTMSDFPETALHIKNNGDIVRKSSLPN